MPQSLCQRPGNGVLQTFPRLMRMRQANKSNLKGSTSPLKDRRTYKAPALEKGLEILECLAAAPSPMTLQQLSLALGWRKLRKHRAKPCI